MPIKGLSDQFDAKMETSARGRTIRIGWLQKGRREGFGKDIKLFDDDHFNFRATDTNGIGTRLEELFTEVYGDKPMAINDVRLPYSLSGNFDIESCAWLTASKHTAKGSVFLGQSDGEIVSRLRNEETGKVVRFSEEEEPVSHTAVSHDDGSKYGAVKYRGKLYPWQQSFSVDLILTELNEAMFKERLSGLGVVTLLTHSTYDIPTLIAEYHGILNEIVSLMANPFDQTSVDSVRRHIPLRNIPLRLYRSIDAVTTPNWKTKDTGDRQNSTRSLLHWQLGADFSLAAQEAMNSRTKNMLTAVANAPLLQSGKLSGEQIDDMFSYDQSPTKQLVPRVEPEYQDTGPQWEDFGDDDEAEIDAEFEEQEPEETAVNPYPEGTVEFWQEAAKTAVSVDALTQAIYKAYEPSGVFVDATKAKTAVNYICGKEPENFAALAAVGVYVNAMADGGNKKAAVDSAKQRYMELIAAA